uniref:Cytochrome P450 n=1 Tax=Oryza sativa subsp. japonica TaxID=39947 RepID=Q94GW6_ORYSJ|nr:putative cytochrome P450 [Oryza sativa Japonica Group]
MEMGSLLPHAASLFAVSMASLMIAAVLSIVRRPWPWKTAAISREAVLRLLGVRLGDVPTTVVRDGAVAVDALVRRADAFSDRPAGGGATSIVSGGRAHNINTVPHGPLWVALRRNLTSEAFHPLVGAMRAAQQEFLRFLPRARVFSTFQKAARLVYPDRWKQLLRHRRRQEEMYLPLIRAINEQRRTRGTPSPPPPTTYVDTLLYLEVPADDGRRRRKLSDGEMVGLVSEYLGAATGTVVAQLEWALANLVRRPDIQTRLCGEVEAAAGGEPCAYLRAVVMECLRRHPPVSSVQRHMVRDVMLGGAHVARGNVIWTSSEEFSPERFMEGGEEGVRLAIGSKQEATTKVKMMPFSAGRRTCPGMGYAILHLEYFLANLVTAFEWRRVPWEEEVDLTADYGFITTMQHPLRALVVPLSNDRSTVV